MKNFISFAEGFVLADTEPQSLIKSLDFGSGHVSVKLQRTISLISIATAFNSSNDFALFSAASITEFLNCAEYKIKVVGFGSVGC